MIKIFKSILLIIIISGCSFKDTTGFWTNEKKLEKDVLKFKPVFNNKERLLKEFNQNYKIKWSRKSCRRVRLASNNLGHIVGFIGVEEILGRIFKDFCIGK